MIHPSDSLAPYRSILSSSVREEGEAIGLLLPAATLPDALTSRVSARARRWIEAVRANPYTNKSISALFARFGLDRPEGLSLMALAEALLRIPDTATANALITDKLSDAAWGEIFNDPGAPWLVGVAARGLSVGQAITAQGEKGKGSPLWSQLLTKMGVPVLREALRAVIGWMANQFVTGQTIHDALRMAAPLMEKGVRFSFDMLGEGARTTRDAVRYYDDYRAAIAALGAWTSQKKGARPSGISVKLSALHPRYEWAQRERVLAELVPRLRSLCELASSVHIPLTIDAEETDRLVLSLEVIEHTLATAQLGAWDGFGMAIQAYQKSAPDVIDHVAALARRVQRRIHIRLVKGAYWDTEIKRAQERGLEQFPVYTRKESTDVSYVACARRLFAAGEWIRPVFASHNAQTLAAVIEIAPNLQSIEVQRLHGMGEQLHAILHGEGIPCCVYAPVGRHDVLLGYLVRRILENGANSSFVHQIIDPMVSIDHLVRDPVSRLLSQPTRAHDALRRAPDLLRPERANACGIDLTNPMVARDITRAVTEGAALFESIPVVEAMLSDIPAFFERAKRAYPEWRQRGLEGRAELCRALADTLEERHAILIALLVVEARRTMTDAVAEVREAIDFCRYYAAEALKTLSPRPLPGVVGEENKWSTAPRGVFIAISPWNFPLAIFLGQAIAALVAGNVVLAKPAPQTPRIACYVAQLMRDIGFPPGVMSVVTGGADIGAALVEHPESAGVVFTGSTATAQTINRSLAAREGPLVPFIAETGGQNALIIDSSALPEQVVDDVITSAFRSAGQRCSALRLLAVPHSMADTVMASLAGAMAELTLGDPASLSTDVGPVIDGQAAEKLRRHEARLRSTAMMRCVCSLPDGVHPDLIAPQMWEIPSVAWMKEEVFGPILHVVRYPDGGFADVVAAVNALGYGLTGGIHSRVAQHVDYVESHLAVGNFYVNRSLIGAVVGMQPFGGSGLSGTGFKAGGPYYLLRFVTERVTSVNTAAAGGNASLWSKL